jgi:hypothetical protein
VCFQHGTSRPVAKSFSSRYLDNSQRKRIDTGVHGGPKGGRAVCERLRGAAQNFATWFVMSQTSKSGFFIFAGKERKESRNSEN